MSPTLELELAGTRVLLDADRALVWDGRVLVADVHLDKAATFQRAGLAVPLGDELRDLERLAAVARRHDAREIIVLGDLVHAPPRRGGPTEHAVLRWAAAHPDLDLSVLLGNHDRDAARRLAHWPVTWITGDHALGPFVLRHEPVPARRGDAFELAGHLHPVLRLRDGNRDAMRLPGFWQRPGGLVLPAFGSFTGGHAVRPGPDSCFHAIVDGTLHSFPAVHGAGRSKARRAASQNGGANGEDEA